MLEEHRIHTEGEMEIEGNFSLPSSSLGGKALSNGFHISLCHSLSSSQTR